MGVYTVGLDYGTNSVRALLVNVANGEELAAAVDGYRYGNQGVLTDPDDPFCARQHPEDYVNGLDRVMKDLLEKARDIPGFTPEKIIGIGVDTTASTPIPVDANAVPLAFNTKYEGNLNAMAWLWKDHSAYREAEELAARIAEEKLPYLDSYGGIYSSEWFWSKIWRCGTADPSIAAASWLEQSDYIPALLTGVADIASIKRNSCAAGYKGMFSLGHGGYPPVGVLEKFAPHLAAVRNTLPGRVYAPGEAIGTLSASLQEKWGLPDGIVVSAGIIDAHAGAIGSGIRPGSLVKIIGTSTCDMALLEVQSGIRAIPGISGVVQDGIIPGFMGIEAGQAAVGDTMNWTVAILPADDTPNGGNDPHETLTAMAKRYGAGASGLLALDWLNGNRNILMDPRLGGLLLGINLRTRPDEIYRAMIEATGFGARMINDRLKEYGVPINEIICGGGIAERNDLFMQIYADILGMPIKTARSSQAPALGAAVCAAVAAGAASGGYDRFRDAITAMTGEREKIYTPGPGGRNVYNELYALYRMLHDAFGTPAYHEHLYPVMKKLIRIKEEALPRQD
ncbi:MAG TPA: ribulokinase [Spirochaetes bacterium]|nr:ribulokinase [Spirochaetota bacterium]